MDKNLSRRSYLRGIAAGSLCGAMGSSGCLSRAGLGTPPGQEYRNLMAPSSVTSPAESNAKVAVVRPAAFEASDALPEIAHRYNDSVPYFEAISSKMEVDSIVGSDGHFALTGVFDREQLEQLMIEMGEDQPRDQSGFTVGTPSRDKMAIGESVIFIQYLASKDELFEATIQNYESDSLGGTPLFDEAAKKVNASYYAEISFRQDWYHLEMMYDFAVESAGKFIEPASDGVKCVTKITTESRTPYSGDDISPTFTGGHYVGPFTYVDPDVDVSGRTITIEEVLPAKDIFY